MKILVVIKRSPPQRFLVELHTAKLVREIAHLLAKRRNSQAIATALAKGKFDREIAENEIQKIKADIILTEENAHWDLTR